MSRLLEIATSMRGRGWEIVIFPFSFLEWLRHHGHDIPEDPLRLTSRRAALVDKHFSLFLETGGFPEAQGMAAPERRQLLQG